MLRQIWAVTYLTLTTLPRRATASLVTMLGVATVVAVMISILAVGAGIHRAVDVNDQPDRVVLLPADGISEFAGAFTTADVAAIAQAPGIKLTHDGRPMVQPLAAVPIELVRRRDGAPQNAMLRGTGEVGNLMNKATLRLVEGRMFTTGLHEIVVGQAAERLYRNLKVGDELAIRNEPWKIVGIYSDQGGIDENALVADVDTVRAAFSATTYQSIGVELRTPGDFQRFSDWIMSNPTLKVRVQRLSDYYHEQTKSLQVLFDFVGIFVGGVMAVGATAGALTTMFSAVDSRSREIATLRAIGFAPIAILTSVMVESLAIAVPGALIGISLAIAAFHGYGMEANGIAFSTVIPPSLALAGALVALSIALVGGSVPALKAAVTSSVADGLKAT